MHKMQEIKHPPKGKNLRCLSTLLPTFHLSHGSTHPVTSDLDNKAVIKWMHTIERGEQPILYTGCGRMLLDNEDLAELFFGRGKRKVYQLCSGDRRDRGRRKRRKLVSADNFIMGPMLYSRTGDNCELWV